MDQQNEDAQRRVLGTIVMNVGMIGIGLMGQGIAANVVKAGHTLRFLDHAGNQPTADLIQSGATSCPTAADVVAKADVVILCVTGSAQVNAVLAGADGVLAHLPKGAVVVDCSTSLPDQTEAMAALTEKAGGLFLDAPMTRTAAHAQAGTLNLLVGGDTGALDQVMPVLDCFTENVTHVGPVGTGHRMKLLHNFVSIGFMTLLAEAAAQSADAGVDPDVLVQVLGNGGGASVALDRFAPFIREGDRNGLPFLISNAVKDIDYYAQMTTAAGAQGTVLAGVQKALDAAMAQGDDAAWLPELVRLFRQDVQ